MNDADIALAYFRDEIEPGLRNVGTPDDGINQLRGHWLDSILTRTNAVAEIRLWWTARQNTFDRDDRERADVRRRIKELADHRPSSLGGDGFGYGPCAGCGTLWPCAASRREETP